MRLCFGLALAILLTGSVHGIIRVANINEGDSYTFTVLTSIYTVEKCHLKTPSGEVIDFAPGDETLSDEKYVIGQGNAMSLCELTLNNADEHDSGTWEMYFTHVGGTGSTQMYIITVGSNAVADSESNESEDKSDGNKVDPEVDSVEESEDDNATLLGEINHFTRQHANIDISLNREIFEEECYIRPPGGRLVQADLLELSGVTVQSKSAYVSCRVTIGPMTEALVGLWRLCGKSTQTEEIRCQPVNIAWNSANGVSGWETFAQPTAAHPVHFGGSVNTGTDGSGTIISCHVITPAGEDLVVSSDVKYPHIEYVATNLPLCSLIFKDFTQDMLGDWVIIGRFRAALGQNENRQPLNFFLYNEDKPYEQAYNVTELQTLRHLVHLGTELTLEVDQRAGVVQNCIYRTPSGETFDFSNYQKLEIKGVSLKSSDTGAGCQITFSPINEGALGKWQITGKFNNGVLFDKILRTFEIIQEDPFNPIEDETDRIIETLTEQIIYTQMATNHRIAINTASFVENESCHLITPGGLQYAFIDGFHIPGVDIINENSVECGIMLNLQSQDMIGNWSLIARATRFSHPIERRLPFTIRVEENFVIQNDISITKGADLYLHLNYGIDTVDTCTIYGPNGEEYADAEKDPKYPDTCGYIVRGVDQQHTGQWILEYGDHIKRRGSVHVHVLVSTEIEFDDLRWTIGDSINIALGPEDAVYCKIEDPYNHVVFDGFGQCKIVLDRAALEHSGFWHMYVGVPGTVLLRTVGFFVSVLPHDGRPTVTTAIERNAPSVMMSCSMPKEHEVTACTFRHPQGDTLVATHGVGEDGYMFNGSFVSYYESDTHSHDCTLRLLNPSVSDLGIWRCSMLTTTGTYHGFLTVVCPHLMQDPEVAASVITEPELHAVREWSYEEDEPVVLSCSIQSELQYCYFRASNGTVYNVFPSMSSSLSYEYVGAGLDAGDCGIRFNNGLAHQEGGMWSCHVGLANTAAVEQRVSFSVDIRAKMLVYHYWQNPFSHSTAVVQATANDPYKIEYCRFVRIDGHGFTVDNMPYRYDLSDYSCIMYINNPNILEIHPWTIAVKFVGLEGEVSMTTTENLLVFMPSNRVNIFAEILFWMLICLVPVMFASALIPKKNREWTYRRASNVRNSFRNSWNNTFKKAPIQEQVVTEAKV